MGPALDGDVQFIIMTMPVGIGAFAENGLVLRFAPMGIIQFMGSIKMFNTGQVHHRFLKICAKVTYCRLMVYCHTMR